MAAEIPADISDLVCTSPHRRRGKERKGEKEKGREGEGEREKEREMEENERWLREGVREAGRGYGERMNGLAAAAGAVRLKLRSDFTYRTPRPYTYVRRYVLKLR